MEENSLAKKSGWHGPKQVGIMVYSGLLMLIASCVVGGSTNTILPAISEQYGWDVNYLRAMAGIGMMFLVVGTFVFATLIKYKGAKISIAISLVVTAIFTALYGNTSNLTLFIAIIFVLGFISGGYMTAGANTLVNNWWPTKKGIVLGFVTMGIVLMDVVWQPFIPVAYHNYGIGPTMIAVAVVILIVAIVGWIVTKNTPEEAGEYPDGDSTHAENIKEIIKAMHEYKSPFTLGVSVKTGAVWSISIGMGLLYMVGMGYVASIVPRLLASGYDYNWALKVLIVGGIFGLVGSWLFGFIDQKIGTKRASMAFAVTLLVAIIISLFHAQSVIAVWVSSIVFFAAQGGCCNLIPSFVGTKFGRWDYPSVYRVIGSVTQLFSGIGVMLTGIFHDLTYMYYFDIVMIIVAFFILIKTNDKFIGKAG